MSVRRINASLVCAVLLLPLASGDARAKDLRAAEASAAFSEVIGNKVRGSYEQLHGCYRYSLAENRRREGTVFFRVTLGHQNRVRRLALVHDKLNHPRTVECLKRLISRWSFPGAKKVGSGPGTQFDLPLTFRANAKQYLVSQFDAQWQPLPPSAYSSRILLSPENAGAEKAQMRLLSGSGEMQLPRTNLDRIYYVVAGKGWVRFGEGKKRNLSVGQAFASPPESTGLTIASGPHTTLALLEISVPIGVGSPVVKADPALSKMETRNTSLAGGKLRVRPLFRRESLGHNRLYLGTLQADASFEVKEHQHETSAEVLFVLSGTGRMSLEGAETDVVARQAIYIPAGKKHWFKVGAGISVVQAYVPAGPEVRFFGDRKKP